MRIGILGSGLMGAALGSLWAASRHDVTYSYSRDRTKLEALARRRGAKARVAEPAEAVAGAEAVLLAVPWHRLDDAIKVGGGAKAFAGKVLISCSLPMTRDDTDLAVAHTTSGAEEIAKRLPEARLVAAFNTIPSELLNARSLKAAARRGRPAVVIYGNDRPAKRTASTLARDIGLEPVDAGPLEVARWAEPFALLVAQLAYQQGLGPALGYRFVSSSTRRK